MTLQSRLHYSGWLLLLYVVLSLPAMTLSAAETTSVVVRSAVQPASGIRVGQRVVYQLDTLAKDGWANVQRMPDLQISGAVVVRMETQGVRLNETIDGQAFSGQRYELLLFPQRGGEITIPATPVEIEISQWGGGVQKQVVQKASPALTFNALTPPGAEKIHGLISTERLSADQQWHPDTKALSVGDTALRRITLSADNVSAMAFAPIVFEAAEAFDVYPKPPTVEDRYDRGDLTARRIEAVTYVFKRAGQAKLPAVTIIWWDLGRKVLQETILPSRAFDIAPPAAAPEARPAATVNVTYTPKGWIYGVTTILLLTVLTVLFRHRLHRRWRTWRDRRRQSEKSFFNRFVRIARGGKPTDTRSALMRWLDRIHEGEQAARLDRFLQSFSDDKGKKAADALTRAADSDPSAQWQGRDLVDSMISARRRWLARRRPSEKGTHLPLLNPQ